MTKRLSTLFVNENIGGHATVHHHLRHGFVDHPAIDASFLDVPPPGLVRRIAGASVPGLDRLDLDLQPLRAQLTAAGWVRRAVASYPDSYDVLHVYTHNAALLSTGLLRAGPSVVSLDTTTAHNGYRLPYRSPTRFTPITVALSKPFEQRAFSAATLVVANSAWAAESLLETYHLPNEKLRVIPFGVRGPEHRPFRENRSCPGDRSAKPRIGFVGRQFVAKGGTTLLAAFDQFLRDDAELLLVTKEKVATRPGVTVVADLEQADPRLWDLLGSCDIFAFPSTIDQAPNAVLEAMAAGLPVVAVDTAAVGEMVIDGETGLLVGPHEIPALGHALRELVIDVDKRKRFGLAGRCRFEEIYDLDIGVRALTDTIVEAAERWKAAR